MSAAAAGVDKPGLLRLLVEAGALQFGEFTLKSGRVSPYFFNAARFDTGGLLARLAEHYAAAVAKAAPQAGVVFGPAYKGVPLAVATAMALSRGGRDVGYLFDRKEEKRHGDRGRFVGRAPAPGEHLVLVDDVITDGQTKLDAVAALRAAFDAPVAALVIAFNRMERDAEGGSAVQRFEAASGVPVVSLLTVDDVEVLGAAGEGAPPELTQAVLSDIRDYRRRYGVA